MIWSCRSTEKIKKLATEIYGADGVEFEPAAASAIKAIEALGDKYAKLPVCMAKTQYSLSDDSCAARPPERV